MTRFYMQNYTYIQILELQYAKVQCCRYRFALSDIGTIASIMQILSLTSSPCQNCIQHLQQRPIQDPWKRLK